MGVLVIAVIDKLTIFPIRPTLSENSARIFEVDAHEIGPQNNKGNRENKETPEVVWCAVGTMLRFRSVTLGEALNIYTAN